MWYDKSIIKTPETHLDHPTVGRYFKSGGVRYFCTSYDPRIGFWMENVADPLDRRNVSERAIGRTFHEIYSFDKEYAEVKAAWETSQVEGHCSHHLVQVDGFTCKSCIYYHECCACGRQCVCGPSEEK